MNASSHSSKKSSARVADEYLILHKVAKILQSTGNLDSLLQSAMQAITEFRELKVENKAGIFLADEDKRTLRLLTTYGSFSQEFLDKEKEVAFGDCLCGRVAVSGELLMSESCFLDARHERTFSDIKEHGHYIVPLLSREHMIGVMFLYTDINPSWYQLSKEVLLSIGGLIADTIQRKKLEEELDLYRQSLENLVEERTEKLRKSNETLLDEIGRHKETQEVLLNSQNQLRKLSQQIQTVREEEKSRISREVHDELGQSLTGLKMDLLYSKDNCLENKVELREQIESMVQVVDNTIKSVQRIAMELRPPILDAFGICDAIVWQAGECTKKLGIRFDLEGLNEPPNLNKDLQTTLFRIFQETLTNIVRHANASRIEVGLIADMEKLQFKIKDNGMGIKDEDIHHPDSLGLAGIRERVYAWNGDVQFQGCQGKGTTVTVEIPLKK